MTHVDLAVTDGVAVLAMNRGKVNALNEAHVDDLARAFANLAADPAVRAVILTGKGKFFSFGLDVPELYDYNPEDFTVFLQKFTGLYTQIFTFPKPVVAAINGHAIAGGCMLASACDSRLMVPGKARISLNEVTFGSSVFAGSVEMLKYVTGPPNAEKILLSGAMYSAEEAYKLDLVDDVITEYVLPGESDRVARLMAANDARAFASIKALARNPVADRMRRLEPDSIASFVDIWYSDRLRQNLKGIQIR